MNWLLMIVICGVAVIIVDEWFRYAVFSCIVMLLGLSWIIILLSARTLLLCNSFIRIRPSNKRCATSFIAYTKYRFYMHLTHIIRGVVHISFRQSSFNYLQDDDIRVFFFRVVFMSDCVMVFVLFCCSIWVKTRPLKHIKQNRVLVICVTVVFVVRCWFMIFIIYTLISKAICFIMKEVLLDSAIPPHQ